MDRSPRLSPGDELGSYEILGSLGAGGMGEVYRARDPRLEREVALKVLPSEMADDPERLERFEREAKALAALNHPHIVTVHSVEESDGIRFLTMELVEGDTLDELIPGGGLELERFLELAIPLADAVATAHSRGVVHRDLKPANVMVTTEGRVKVLDFGLARRDVSRDEEALASLPTETLEEVTREGQVVGTVPYMAPEQIQGQAATARSDIFSLGAVLHEMATGKRPFTGETGADLISAILRDEPPPVSAAGSELPRQLGRIVARCLAKDSERRFQTALDVRNELEELRDEVVRDVRVETVAPSAAPSRGPGRSGWLVGAVAAAGVVLVGLLAWAILPSRRTEPDAAGTGPSVLRSLVVLPATVHGPAGDAYLADAIPGTLSTELTGIEGLETKAPPRSAELEGKEMGLERLAEIYGVDALVLPSVTAEGDQFLLTLQLVEAADRSLVWSEQYRGSRAEYLDLVERAAVELQRRLRPGRTVGASVTGLTASSPAELAFRRGQYFSNRFNSLRQEGDYQRAHEAFQEALAIDPKMAEAAAEVGWLYYLRAELGDLAMLDEAERWAQQSLELDRATSLAWVDLSLTSGLRGNYITSLRSILEAAVTGPANARAQSNLGWRLAVSGLPELCTPAAEESIRLDPLYLVARTVLAACFSHMGQTTRGLEILDQTLEIEPDEVFARTARIWLLLEANRLDEARAALEKTSAPGTFGSSLAVLRARLALQAGTSTAEATGKEFLRIAREVPHRYVMGFITVTLDELAQRRPGEVLFTLLEETERVEGAPLAYQFVSELAARPFLRQRPEFQAMLERSRAKLEEVLEILAAAERDGRLPPYLKEPLDEALREYS